MGGCFFLEAAQRANQETSHKEVVKSTDLSQALRFKSWLYYLLGQWACYFTPLHRFPHLPNGHTNSTMFIGFLGRGSQLLPVRGLGWALELGNCNESVCHSFFFFPIFLILAQGHFFIAFREGGGKRKGERETSM